jgi:hypothetical protein
MFDLAVLSAHDRRLIPLVFAALDADAVLDTMLADRLLLLYDGTQRHASLSLAAVAKRRLGYDLDKGEDTFRLRYGELYFTPLAQWPRSAIEYALRDPWVTLAAWRAQTQVMPVEDVFRPLPQKVRTHYALYMAMQARGIVPDREAVDALETKIHAELATLREELQREGLVDQKGVLKKAPTQALVEACYGSLGLNQPVPKTDPTEKFPGGQTKTDAATLVQSQHPLGVKAARYNGLNSKGLGTQIKWLRQGLDIGACRTGRELKNGKTERIDPLLDTGRVAAGVLLTVPQKGGYRECFKPRPGYVYGFLDYGTAELRSLAQSCLWRFGHSRMAEVLRDPTKDLHVEVAALLLGISPEEAYRMRAAGLLKDPRNTAKKVNFGLGGGMGPPTYVATCVKDVVKEFVLGGDLGYIPTEAEVKQQKQLWIRTWPEMKQHFEYVDSQLFGEDRKNRRGRFRVPVAGLYAGARGYTQGCNFQFQPITAAGATDALYAVARACYTDRYSSLYGSRPVLFVHDEIGLELAETRASDAAYAARDIMVDCMARYTPDVPPIVEPTLARVWSKQAKTITNPDGTLVPWDL